MPIKKMLESNYRNTCGVCGGLGHNARSCPQLKTVAETALQKEIDGYSLTWSEAKAIRTYLNKKKTKPKKPRRKPHCGFCGEPSHNRKTCPAMKDIKRDLYIANANWRKAFLSKVRDVGFAEGALVQYTTTGLFGRGSSKTKSMGIIKHTKMKDLTVLSSREWAKPNGHWRNTEYEARTGFSLYLNSRTDMLFRSHVDNDVFFFEVAETAMTDARLLPTHREWSNMGRVDVLQPAKVKLTDRWIAEENIHMLEWLVKNTNTTKLNKLGLQDVFDRWL